MWEGKAKSGQPSRMQIIDWINSTLQLDLSSIEQLGSGAVFCELLSQAYPTAIPQHRINRQASNEYEFASNFRLLQRAFGELGIERPLDVAALAKAQYKDNFELAVWFYWEVGGQQVETDCTLSSNERPQFDFSFAHRKVTPKYFSPHRCHKEGPCACPACSSRGERRALQRLRELEVKFEMMAEVLESGSEPGEKCFLIEEIIGLSV